MASKSKETEVLELELRNKIFYIVKKYAGSHLRELERISKIPYSTLKYHLHFLAKHNIIIEKKEESNIKYYPKTISFEDIEILSLLRQKNVRKMLIYFLTNKNVELSDLESTINLSASTTSWYLKKLLKRGIIKKEKIGKKIYYILIYNKNRIIQVLITYKKSFADSLLDKTIDAWEIR